MVWRFLHLVFFTKKYHQYIDNIEYRYYTAIRNIDIRCYEKREVMALAREQYQTLTEQMYYILLALLEPRCGVDISAKAEEISKRRIQIGPGTLYTLLGKFEEEKVILEVRSEGRKRYYQITDKGMEMLRKEYERLQLLVEEGRAFLQ